MVENLGESLDIKLLAGRAIGGGRGRRELDAFEVGRDAVALLHYSAPQKSLLTRHILAFPQWGDFWDIGKRPI